MAKNGLGSTPNGRSTPGTGVRRQKKYESNKYPRHHAGWGITTEPGFWHRATGEGSLIGDRPENASSL